MCSSQWEFTRSVSGAAASPLNQPLDAVAIQACYQLLAAPHTGAAPTCKRDNHRYESSNQKASQTECRTEGSLAHRSGTKARP